MSELQISTGSPVKHVDFQRGNSRVVSNVPLSPRNAMLRRRPGATPQKYRAAQQQSRKPSNPIVKPKLESLVAPKLNPPLDLGANKNEEDEWQDIEPQNQEAKPRAAFNGPDLRPPSHQDDNAKSASQDAKKSAWKQQSTHPDMSTLDTTTDGGSTTNTNSFFGFSPSNMSASFIRKLGKHGRNFKRSSWRPSTQFDRADSTSWGSQGFPYARKPVPEDGHLFGNSFAKKSFWLDPTTPGLLALYLQVGFNLVMVGALLYAIAAFYSTIRNDVNLKVEEYSVDIVDQIAKCSFEYLRNGCEPGKRVPAIEAACQQWERCMQRDPKEVGRARVSAETFGSIIEAFLKPIGIKSMIFLIGVFAGSFLLVNAVFSSRIGPRFSADNAHAHHPFPQQLYPTSQPHPAPQAANIQNAYQPQVASFAAPAHSSVFYSPSPQSSPRPRQQSIHATLQSSPVHQPPFLNYPY